jgi:hypothetical protein
VPVVDGDKPAGTAWFSTNRDFYALIPQNANPQDVRVRVEYPDAFEATDEIACVATFELAGEEPVALGTMPLTARMEYPRPTQADSAGHTRGSLGLDEFLLVFFPTLLCLSLAAGIWIFTRHSLAEKRRRSRRAQRRRARA